MGKRIVIVGGGAAGWLTAAYLTGPLSVGKPGGVEITLVEAPDIPILGVGEGTFPSILKTLKRIGLDEGDFIKGSGATFKQGIRFDHWLHAPGEKGRDHYFHPFQSAQSPDEMALLPYWLLGHAGKDIGWDEAVTVQKAVADQSRGPKTADGPQYDGPLRYAYHFDAMSFAAVLRDKAKALGVRHLVDRVEDVALAEDGSIASLTTRENGSLSADLYIDCTGFRAQLIGQALKAPFSSCRSSLFCDRAVAMPVPYERPDAPIASYTICAAQEAGWIWDIGLRSRRGIGHVFSSAHTDEDRAEQVLRNHIGPAAEKGEVRTFRFEPGFRETPWVKNCVAVGLAGGFFEPLEATGIVTVEVAAWLISYLFPWGGDTESSARQFNHFMRRRYERIVDFLKLHYCLTKRTDNDFWRDNADPASIPDSLKDLLDRWRFREPDAVDFDMNYETFADMSWQFVLYGMGFKTDISAKAAAFPHIGEAQRRFRDIGKMGARAQWLLPSHRELVETIHRQGFRPPAPRIGLSASLGRPAGS